MTCNSTSNSPDDRSKISRRTALTALGAASAVIAAQSLGGRLVYGEQQTEAIRQSQLSLSEDMDLGGDELLGFVNGESRRLTRHAIKAPLTVSNVAEMRLLNAVKDGQAIELLGYFEPGDGGGGSLYVDGSDMATPDNGGTVFVTEQGKRIKRPEQSSHNVREFGADGTPSGNMSAFNRAKAAGVVIDITGDFHADTSIMMNNNAKVRLFGRIVGDPAMTEPVVRFVSNYCSLEGIGAFPSIVGNGHHGGHVDSTKNGIINFGPPNIATYANVLWNKLHNIKIEGSKARWDRYNASIEAVD